MDEAETVETWLTVGEVARHAGLSVRTLHHYDQLGLLQPGGRSANGYRLYSPADLARLLQIQHLKSLGLSLEEVGAALDVEEAHNTIAQAQGSADDRVAQVASRLFSNRRATASSG